ncbi:unnamed protein product [Protopolystoma xenopodis]|uniref:Ras-GAP domain-containing protein n=1 Tax=Protopolystoma xenopodis TaxID=117903 RepID=A0A448WDD1_9PLAT|nr:unnamed protein product [Protopolystoma xenopodis]
MVRSDFDEKTDYTKDFAPIFDSEHSSMSDLRQLTQSNMQAEVTTLFSAATSQTSAFTLSSQSPRQANGETGKETQESNPAMATVGDHIISACVFLRFICPAILSPSLFHLTNQFPSDPRIIRTFTLLELC